MSEILPPGWEPDFYTGLLFFVVELALVVLLLPLVVASIQRKRENRIWRAPRAQLLRLLRSTCVELHDIAKLLDWTTRSWLQWSHSGGTGRVARSSIRGASLASIANEIDSFLTGRSQWPHSNFHVTLNILVQQILAETSRARAQIDVLSMSVNEDMAKSVGDCLIGLSAAEDAAKVLYRHIGFFEAAASPSRHDPSPSLVRIDQQLNSQLSGDLGVQMRALSISYKDDRIVRADSITFASQIRLLLQAYAQVLASVLALSDQVEGAGDSAQLASEVRRRIPFDALQLCRSADQVANAFSDTLIRELSGVGASLETAPETFVAETFAPLGAEFSHPDPAGETHEPAS
jgi:hypothetical protein